MWLLQAVRVIIKVRQTTVALETVVKEKSDNLQITKLNDGYRINTKKTGKLELGINQDLTNKILIVEFDLAKVKLIKRKDTSITINGVKISYLVQVLLIQIIIRILHMF